MGTNAENVPVAARNARKSRKNEIRSGADASNSMKYAGSFPWPAAARHGIWMVTACGREIIKGSMTGNCQDARGSMDRRRHRRPGTEQSICRPETTRNGADRLFIYLDATIQARNDQTMQKGSCGCAAPFLHGLLRGPGEGGRNHVDTGSAGKKTGSLKRQKKSCCKKQFADIPFAAARLQAMPFGSRFFTGFQKRK